LCSARTYTASPTSKEDDADGPESISEDDPSQAMGRLPGSESPMVLKQTQMLTTSYISNLLDRVDNSSDKFNSRLSRDSSADTFTETVESLEAFYEATVRSERSGPFDQSTKVLVKKDREGTTSSCSAPEPPGPPIPLGSLVRLSGLTAATEYNGRTALFQSWEPALSRGLVQLLPPGFGAGEMRVIKMRHLELVK